MWRILSKCLAGLAAVGLGAAPLCAIVELDNSLGVTDADYQNLAAQYPSVGKFAGNFPQSGVLIGSDWVLTAAHVAATLTNGSSTFVIGGINYTVTQMIINPGYNGTTLANDVALIKLSGNVTNVTPAILYNGTSELGVQGTWVGFGETGTGISGANGTGRGTARGATNFIDGFYDYPTGGTSLTNGNGLLADFDDGTLGNNTLANLVPPVPSSPTPTTYEGSLAAGDSGGGVFGTISSTVFLIGINDFVSPGAFGSDTQYGAILGATRVSAYTGWIASEIPEPSAATVVGGMLVGLLVLARQRKLVR